MAEHQVGNIVYQVSMDVARLLTAQRQLDSRLDRWSNVLTKQDRRLMEQKRRY
ncbi:hypothetical protein [Xenorhabdus sp. SGI240]|uniref:hypothetical protein n=1 Tax=Xenorhabdus sp. SGI240 TaxID=3158262 RepID=UPI0032B735B4